MSVKDQKKSKNAGLGRSLGDLLSDNEELGNVENKVLMHRGNGSTVKIYNKIDAKSSTKNGRISSKGSPKSDVGGMEVSISKRAIPEEILAGVESADISCNVSQMDAERVCIGKTREEREEEARGIYRSGKPHVIPEGERTERIRINAQPKPAPEPERIVLDGSKTSNEGISEALGRLKNYSPRASDEFLDALRDMTDVPEIKDYPTDKNGRIIIGASKSRVKKR